MIRIIVKFQIPKGKMLLEGERRDLQKKSELRKALTSPRQCKLEDQQCSQTKPQAGACSALLVMA